MKAAFKDSLASTSATDAAELLLAELRASRKRLQQLIRLVSEEAGRELPAAEAVRAQRPQTQRRYKCRAASSIRISAKRMAGAA